MADAEGRFDVPHIARLARLSVDAKEVPELEQQLTAIVAYVHILDQLQAGPGEAGAAAGKTQMAATSLAHAAGAAANVDASGSAHGHAVAPNSESMPATSPHPATDKAALARARSVAMLPGLRADVVTASLPVDMALKNAPERMGDGFGVPKIIE